MVDNIVLNAEQRRWGDRAEFPEILWIHLSMRPPVWSRCASLKWRFATAGSEITKFRKLRASSASPLLRVEDEVVDVHGSHTIAEQAGSRHRLLHWNER